MVAEMMLFIILNCLMLNYEYKKKNRAESFSALARIVHQMPKRQLTYFQEYLCVAVCYQNARQKKHFTVYIDS
jgi:hypothetical protein